jgi:hypothetical protein
MQTENGSLDYLENDWDRCPVCDRHECECPPETDMQNTTATTTKGAPAQPETAVTLFVENRVQAALYEWEMKGQMSDGQWENSRPHGHWRTPNEAQVVVRPGKVGRNFYTERAYNFANRDLFEAVSHRMVRFAKIAIFFSDVSIDALAEYRWDFDNDLTADSTGYSNSYKAHKDAQIADLLKLVGVANRAEFESRVGSVAYDEKKCRRDLNRLTACFRTQIADDYVVSATTHKPVANTVAGILGSWASR